MCVTVNRWNLMAFLTSPISPMIFYVLSIDKFFSDAIQRKKLPGLCLFSARIQTFSNNMNKSLKANYWQLFSMFHPCNYFTFRGKKTKTPFLWQLLMDETRYAQKMCIYSLNILWTRKKKKNLSQINNDKKKALLYAKSHNANIFSMVFILDEEKKPILYQCVSVGICGVI